MPNVPTIPGFHPELRMLVNVTGGCSCLPCCLQDNSCNGIWTRNHREVARPHLYGRDAHPLRHKTFEIRVDRSIFCRYRILSRLCSPSRMHCPGCEKLPIERFLDSMEYARFCRRYISGKVTQKRLFAQLPPFAGPDNACGGRRLRIVHWEPGIILACIGSPCCNIDKRVDLGINPGLRYYMSEKECSTSTVGPSCIARTL